MENVISISVTLMTDSLTMENVVVTLLSEILTSTMNLIHCAEKSKLCVNKLEREWPLYHFKGSKPFAILHKIMILLTSETEWGREAYTAELWNTHVL